MATEQISVDTQELKKYSGELKTSYQKMFSYLSQARTSVKSLKSTWTGPAANEFYARFDSIIVKSEEVLKVVDGYSRALSETAQVYDANEKTVADNAGKLKIQLK